MRLTSKALSVAAACAALAACGKLSTKESGAKSGADDTSAGVVIDDPTRPATVAITSGELAGVAVEVPAGTLPQGSRVQLRQGQSPSAFGEAAGEEGAVASQTIELTITSEAGEPIVAEAGTLGLSLPLAGDLALALAPVERRIDNLVCLFQDGEKGLKYWPASRFAGFDAEKKVAKVAVRWSGVYQLAFVEGGVPTAGGFESLTVDETGPVITDLGALTCPAGTESFYEKAKGNASFKSYYDLYVHCTCTVPGLSSGACGEAVHTAFKASVCATPETAASIAEVTITKMFDDARVALSEHCQQ